MPESWIKLLKGITPNQIIDGLNRLKDRKSEFPPDGVAFRQLCLPVSISPNGTNSGAYKVFEPEKRIEDKTYVSKREKAAKRELGAMKDMFK